MITQSQVVDFLHKNLELFGNKKHKTLGEFPQFFKDVHSVKDSELTIDAFSKMVEHVSFVKMKLLLLLLLRQ